MAGVEARPLKDLFRDWRGGDRDAGQVMAQRFADWYYAVTTARLGEERGDAACRASCQRFSQGIGEVKDPRALVLWAHQIVREEVEKVGSRSTDGDAPNPYTAGQSPKRLLFRARVALPNEMALLEACYSGRASREEVDRLAAPLGGNPIGVLRARYRIKAWLRDNTGVPFQVAPENPVLDRAPLPLYESCRMATPDEEATFEQWMITDLDLCRDIAEFAHYAIALRGGIPADMPATPAPAPSVPAAPVVTLAEPPDSSSMTNVIIGGVVVTVLVAAVAVVAGLVAMFVLR